jgi:hypothetical protein
MTVKEFKFLSPDDVVDPLFQNWSRCYEWGYVLSVLKSKSYETIHNTCCGTEPLHALFAHDLAMFGDVYNSDVFTSETNTALDNFFIYNINGPLDRTFDMVLCISTLEEIPERDTKSIYLNLYEQVKEGGRLIITCDYPQVSVEELEDIADQKIYVPDALLNGGNSIYKNAEFEHLNIILLDVEK